MSKKTPLVRSAIPRPAKSAPVEDAAEAFVGGGQRETGSSLVPVEEPATPAPVPTKRLTFDIPEDLHFRLKLHAMMSKTTISDVIRDFLNEQFPAR